MVSNFLYNMQQKKKKRNEIMPFAATCVDPETVILSDVSQTEKEKHHMTSLACGIYNDTNALIYNTETDLENELTIA